MKLGVSVYETYEGPELDAVEFCLHDDFSRRSSVLADLSSRFEVVSAHLPSFMHVRDVEKETAFNDGSLHHFVAHVTKRSTGDDDWASSWKFVRPVNGNVLFENHNQDWHPTDAGLCWAEQFKPIADSGHSLCLDVGHVLYASMFRALSYPQWIDEAEKAFDGFLELPISAVHVHTVDRFQGMDHQLSGFDIGPWLKRIVSRNPGVILLCETMDHPVADKVSALKRWLE
jgi:hypothetical protein